MAIVLWLIFKVRWRLLPLLAVLLGVLWSFSLLGLIGIDLSLVTIAGLPILIGLGIDFAIQVHNRIEEEVLLDHDEHPIGETLANLAPPLIAATITGVVAFLALRISKVPMIRDFGVLLAVGIVCSCSSGSSSRRRRWRPRASGRRRASRRVAGSSTSSSSSAACRRRWLPIIALLSASACSSAACSSRSEPRSRATRSSGSTRAARSSQDIERLEDETGFSTTLGILVQATTSTTST